MSDHEIHNEACGCWHYPPPVTVRMADPPASRGEAQVERLKEALWNLLAQWAQMNRDLRVIGKGRPEMDDSAHPDSPAFQARELLAEMEK